MKIEQMPRAILPASGRSEVRTELTDCPAGREGHDGLRGERGFKNGQSTLTVEESPDFQSGVLQKSESYYRCREKFDLVVNGPALFNAVISGLEFGIFKFLSEQPESHVQKLVDFTRLRYDKLRPLLQALCAMDLLVRKNGNYSNSSFAEEQLISTGYDSWMPILLGWQKIYYPSFIHMTEALRDGTNKKALSQYPGNESTLYQRLEHTPELQKTFHAAMGAFSLKSMSGLLENPEIAKVRTLLDIGGNDGTTANELVKHFPEIQVTVFDLPTVTEIVGNLFRNQDKGRVKLAPGNIFTDPFPKYAEAVLFSHVLEIFSEEQIVFLLRKAYEALPVGGKVFIYGFNVTQDEQVGVYSARLALYLNVLASGQGMAYPKQDWERWLTQAGFVNVSTYSDLPFEHGLNVGMKE